MMHLFSRTAALTLFLPALVCAETSVSFCAPQAVMPTPPLAGAVLIIETCPTPAPVFGGQPIPPGDAPPTLPGFREGEPSPGTPTTAPCVVTVWPIDQAQRLEHWQKRVMTPEEIALERLPMEGE